jgi:putative molybdopterin biosynthesis protein
MNVQNNLAQIRRQQGISAGELAAAVAVSRQTIYAIESRSYTPNTALALKLARKLGVTVEQLFQLEDEPKTPHMEQVELLAAGVPQQPGQALQLCKVDGRLIAAPAEASTWGLPQADAVLHGRIRRLKPIMKSTARVLDEGWESEHRLLIAGCDPGAAILAHFLRRQGVEVVISYQNSLRALELLKFGAVHVAGTHLLDERTGESNLPRIHRIFGREPVAVFSFALWEEGIVVARGNPKSIKGVADFVRRDVKISNREAGAGCRLLLDLLLRRAGISGRQVNGYDRIAFGHLPAARDVQSGAADGCISTRAAARIFGLDFIPLATKRYDLAIRNNHLKLPQVAALLETLGRAALRRELEGFAGYDMKPAGNRLM